MARDWVRVWEPPVWLKLPLPMYPTINCPPLITAVAPLSRYVPLPVNPRYIAEKLCVPPDWLNVPAPDDPINSEELSTFNTPVPPRRTVPPPMVEVSIDSAPNAVPMMLCV